MRIADDEGRLPAILAKFVESINPNPRLQRATSPDGETFFAVETDLGRFWIYPQSGYQSYEYEYGLMVTSEIALELSDEGADLEAWYRAIVHFVNGTKNECLLVEGGVCALYKSGVFYPGDDFPEGVLADLDTPIRHLDDLKQWDATHYIAQTHHVMIRAEGFSTNDVLKLFLYPLDVLIEPEKSLYSSLDMTAVATSASRNTLTDFHALNSAFPIEPTHIIEITPFTPQGYREMLTCLNEIVGEDVEVVFTWQGIAWVLKKYGSVYLDSDHQYWYTHYGDVLDFQWKMATILSIG